MNESEQPNLPNGEKEESQNSGKSSSRQEVTVFKGGKGWPTISEWILIGITFILAICNVWIIHYASYQSDAAIKAVGVADSEFNYQRQQDIISSRRQYERDSVQNIKDSLFADSQSKRDAFYYRTTVIGNRAYINIVDIDTLILKVNEPIDYRIVITNSGKTPATNIRAVLSIKTGTGVYSNDFDSLESRFAEATQMGSLGAGQIYLNEFPPIGTQLILRNKDSISIYNRTSIFFIYGKLTYEDKFGGDHFTRFAFKLEPDRLKGKKYFFDAYKHFNDGD